MDELELLEKALEETHHLSELINRAYQSHDHETDLKNGILLSSLRLQSFALEQAIITAILNIK